MAESNHCVLFKHAIEWLNGELLGDGCLHSLSSCAAYFSYGSKYLEYIDYVSGTLNSFGVLQTGKIYKYYGGLSSNGVYHYHSRYYCELKPLWDKWYPEGKKIVPRDIKLTSLTCRQWYIGDGWIIHKFNGNACIRLAVCAFSTYDVDWLIEQLSDLGILATRQPAKNLVNIAACSTKDFLNYIGRCPVKCYKYKRNYFNKEGGDFINEGQYQFR